MSWLEAFIVAVVEGLTEFLPVSSTGHMIITEALLGMQPNDFSKAFIINIQFGAILSVIVLYWRKFFQSFTFYLKLLVAFIPAAVFGFLAGDLIDQLLESVVVVALMLVLGGIILLYIDKWFSHTAEHGQEDVSYSQALKIGLFQCIAMIPGVSRSAATIIGGMTQKLNRKAAAEFSFFLAIPTMFAASAYKLLKNYQAITSDTLPVLIFGNIVAFLVAMAAIRFFITFLTRHGFKVFGWYRIVVGGIILILLASGHQLNIIG
ncbi:MAG: undecaprenyl-diphosphate phosphatase [Bacteroidales bacterium]|jgi:undecaprenyl-diphosphatase|nr:undecaprenyl-diphosphate phosphatase [Bacteroidales bacterium]NPV35948.1 undecaprenyl-diphosphate phosphatase [Bacteroidales bacterium]